VQTLFRYILAFIVFVSLTSGPLCIDQQCSAEESSCCSLEDEPTACAEDDSTDEHAEEQQPDDHCASCPQCSASVLVTTIVTQEQVITAPLIPSVLIEHTLAGWVTLPERPPSVA
jgi:hypothetical protein